MPSNHLILCHPLLLLPSIFPSIRVLSNESVLRIRWPKYWSFSFSISPSNAYSGLISFRMDWLDLLAVQGTLKSLPQHHSSKHQFFSTQFFAFIHSMKIHYAPNLYIFVSFNPKRNKGKLTKLRTWEMCADITGQESESHSEEKGATPHACKGQSLSFIITFLWVTSQMEFSDLSKRIEYVVSNTV